jgi:hypothetical protein
MYWIVDDKKTGKMQHKASAEDGVTILPIVYEEKQEISYE